MRPFNKHIKSCTAISVTEDDGILWRRFKNGDQAAFSSIYHANIQGLYSYGVHISDDTDLVEDCIQDLFIYLWDNRGNLSETNNIKFYLFKSLRRKILKTLELSQKKNILSKAFKVSQPEMEYSHEHCLISGQIQDEGKEIIGRAMQALTKRQREAIRLKFYDNLSFQEIAGHMSLNIKSTYNLISRALEVLRHHAHFCLFVCFPFLFP